MMNIKFIQRYKMAQIYLYFQIMLDFISCIIFMQQIAVLFIPIVQETFQIDHNAYLVYDYIPLTCGILSN